MNLRNVAIIAHVDHGKTTLVDQLFRQSGTFRDNEQVEERVMDSMDQERERGITITAKNTAVEYEGVHINIIDTPGHADFGGEVERVLNMADGVLLLVDAVEGAMPQTRFVLKKALACGLSPIVVLNKVDRPAARHDVVINETFELFVELGATDEQCEFPVVYASALEGRASLDDPKGGTDLKPLFKTIIEHVPEPFTEDNQPARMVVTSLGYDDYLGRLVVGKLRSGSLKVGQPVKVFAKEKTKENFKVTRIMKRIGMRMTEVPDLRAGDIATLAGIDATIGDTIADPGVQDPLPRIEVDPPTLSMHFLVNDSPLAGTEGKFVTSRHLRERLFKEAEHNVSLRVAETDSAEIFSVAGRGELHLSVLIESMRREGFEFQVSQPVVILKTDEEGRKTEPYERVHIEVPNECSGAVIDALNQRKGEMLSMLPEGEMTLLEYIIPSRGLLGYHSQFLTDTRGEGTLYAVFDSYGPFKGDITRRSRGAILSNIKGDAVAYAIFSLQPRGVFFIAPGTKVYPGMILGEHAREDDLEVNICREKKLTNIRAAGSDEALRIVPAKKMTIESCIEFMAEDELLEVTPKSLRLRKRALDAKTRRKR